MKYGGEVVKYGGEVVKYGGEGRGCEVRGREERL